ncbi:Rap1a/Tai family immunity protein [Magnetovibrio sp. PR-2]|uniref:Rap1a/Tai family immunity protein n=1 Tax=Magnetovibrio sp. PR-2 TaxID=3120356 RepID=UPI002FCE493D
MKTSMHYLLALGLVFATPAVATDAFSGAEDLRGWCSSMDQDDVHWGLCVGSVAAVHDTVMTYQSFEEMRQVICTGPDTSRGDLVITVMEYMENNPGTLEYSLGDVVFSALREAYPCP